MVPRKLPSDLEEEILFRVPPLSLHRFRSVCKEWNTLFNNKRFVHKNLACGPQEFMLRTHSHIYSISVDLNDDPTIKVRDRFELSGHRYHLEGTYDGNFFMYDFYKGGRGVVSNPLLRQTRWIPADEIICSMSMSYDGSRPETSYSIIGDNSYNTDHLAGKVTRRFAVFEFATNAWKITNHTSFHKESHSELIVSNSDRVSLNGNLYWTAYNYNETGQYFIIMLDFSKEIEKRRIFCILPFKGKKACTHTRGLAIYKGDRFSALEQCARTREIEIWVTKNKIGNGDDGDNVVWIKFMTVSIPNFPLVCHNMSSSYFVDNNIYGKSFVMCCLNEKPKQAWIYIARGDVCKKIKVDEVLCEFLSYVYVPSLITIS